MTLDIYSDSAPRHKRAVVVGVIAELLGEAFLPWANY